MRLKEGLKAGDLEGVVNRRFSIDQYKSKMGEDRNIMVLSFVVDGLEPKDRTFCRNRIQGNT